MKRRTFLETLPTVGVGLGLWTSTACNLFSNGNYKGTQHIKLRVISSNPINVPRGKRVAFGWTANGIMPNGSIVLKPEKDLPETNLFLRISTAQETWDKKLVHVKIVGKNTTLGIIDIRSSSVLVPYELEVDKKHARSINENGLELLLEASEPLWIFDQQSRDMDNGSLCPHLLATTEEHGSVQDFSDRFMSVNSIQAFGWREGTVLDGLWQLYSQKGEKKALEVIKKHLNLFFDENNNLIFENARSIPKLN